MSMQRYELEAWLGPALDDMTAEQVDAFAAMVDRIETRYPGRDHGQHPDEEAAVEAMSGALMVLLGDDALCFDLETCTPELLAYVRERLVEACRPSGS